MVNHYLFLVLYVHVHSPAVIITWTTRSFIFYRKHAVWMEMVDGTVPTFVCAHTFYASRKPWFSSTRALGLTLTQSTTLSRTRLKWKQNLATVTKSSLMNLSLNQEQQNSSISLTTNCLRLPAENLAVICRKLYWNPTVNMYLQMA